MLQSGRNNKCASNDPEKSTLMKGMMQPKNKPKKVKSERLKRTSVVKAGIAPRVAKLGGDNSLPASMTMSKNNSTKDLGGLLQQRKLMSNNLNGQKSQGDCGLGSNSCDSEQYHMPPADEHSVAAVSHAQRLAVAEEYQTREPKKLWARSSISKILKKNDKSEA